MHLYLISQSTNTGYDTYDSAVVAAEDEDSARRTHPSEFASKNWWENDGSFSNSWADKLEQVEVEFLGPAAMWITEPRIICASFNAG